MNIKIFSCNVSDKDDRQKFQEEVNDFLSRLPGATLEWLQSSAKGLRNGLSVAVPTLTAIVTYNPAFLKPPLK